MNGLFFFSLFCMDLKKMIRLLIFLSILYAVYGIEYAPIINIDSGQVRGYKSQLNDGDSIYIYQGIRYGKLFFFTKLSPF